MYTRTYQIFQKSRFNSQNRKNVPHQWFAKIWHFNHYQAVPFQNIIVIFFIVIYLKSTQIILFCLRNLIIVSSTHTSARAQGSAKIKFNCIDFALVLYGWLTLIRSKLTIIIMTAICAYHCRVCWNHDRFIIRMVLFNWMDHFNSKTGLVKSHRSNSCNSGTVGFIGLGGATGYATDVLDECPKQID